MDTLLTKAGVPRNKPVAISKLIRMYRFMENHRKEKRYLPSIAQLVEEEFSPSTSVIRYNLKRMEELKMIEIFRDDNGVMFARGYDLLPLEDASPLVQAALQIESEKEK